MELFLSELDNLLKHLGIQDDYDLLGQSWGGKLGSEHAALQPRGLKKLILADAPASSSGLNMFDPLFNTQMSKISRPCFTKSIFPFFIPA